eukprot:3548113-Rhodomonas_salina.2
MAERPVLCHRPPLAPAASSLAPRPRPPRQVHSRIASSSFISSHSLTHSSTRKHGQHPRSDPTAGAPKVEACMRCAAETAPWQPCAQLAHSKMQTPSRVSCHRAWSSRVVSRRLWCTQPGIPPRL